MDLLRSLSIRAVEAAVVFLIIAIIPGLPPQMEFSTSSTTPSLPLEGVLSLNNKLDNAEHLFEGDIKGPEALVIHNGELYTGVHGGQVIKIVGGKIHHVAQFGKKCDGLWEERVCGRPLGMKFDKENNLYVADAYYGIFKVNTKTDDIVTLVPINETIDGKPPKIPNSVDVGSDGSVYWSDSSTEVTIEDGVFALLGDGSGRLLKYDPRTKKNRVLMDHLSFANGVVLSPAEDFVLVAETAKSRILRYYLRGSKAGERDIFIDGLPGLPDNLKLDGDGGFFVPLVVARDSAHPVIFQMLGPFPILRKFLARMLALIEMPIQYINRIHPNYYAKRAVHWIGHFESVSMMVPKRVSILQLDVNGNIKNSLHCLDGSLSGISDVTVFNGAYYFGSPYNSYIGRVKIQDPVSNKPVKSVKG